jgi:hypothetical protein
MVHAAVVNVRFVVSRPRGMSSDDTVIVTSASASDGSTPHRHRKSGSPAVSNDDDSRGRKSKQGAPGRRSQSTGAPVRASSSERSTPPTMPTLAASVRESLFARLHATLSALEADSESMNTQVCTVDGVLRAGDRFAVSQAWSVNLVQLSPYPHSFPPLSYFSWHRRCTLRPSSP